MFILCLRVRTANSISVGTTAILGSADTLRFFSSGTDAAGSMQKRALRSSQISSMKNVHGCTFFIRDAVHTVCVSSRGDMPGGTQDCRCPHRARCRRIPTTQSIASSSQLPPRSTRSAPEAAPCGSVTNPPDS